MEEVTLSLNGKGWVAPRGSMSVWLPAPSFLVLQLAGHGESAFLAPLLVEYQKVARHSACKLFVDAERLANYDSGLRTGLTSRFSTDRARISEFSLLVGSKLVAMGVSVANMALGGIVSAYGQRRLFIERLDTQLFQSGIVGFSSNVLETTQAPAERRRAR